MLKSLEIHFTDFFIDISSSTVLILKSLDKKRSILIFFFISIVISYSTVADWSNFFLIYFLYFHRLLLFYSGSPERGVDMNRELSRQIDCVNEPLICINIVFKKLLFLNWKNRVFNFSELSVFV